MATAATPPRASGGVDAVVNPDGDDEALVAYDTGTLTESVLALMRQADAYEPTPDVALDGGGVYFLDPQFISASGAVPARLFRFVGR